MFLTPDNFIRDYSIRSLVCCWSGGRSSLAATHYMLSSIADFDIDKRVVIVDTGVMLPDVVPYAEKICESQGWTLTVLKPKTDYWQYSARYGTPGIKRRWCCKILKLQPIFDFVKTLNPQRGMVLGFRADEKRESRRKSPQVRYVKKASAWIYLPIKNWTTMMVRQYLRQNSLPEPPWYRKGLKETCLCGAYTNRKELLRIKTHYPELFERFKELDAQRQKWGRCAFWNGGPISLSDIEKQKTLG